MAGQDKILIVDDDSLNVEILQELLEEHYQLAIAHSGEEALHILDSFMPDLILLDIMMPGLSGYDVCRKVREGETHKYTKIILVSAKAFIHERLEGYRSGADDYITKPFELEELLAKVQVFLQFKHMEEVNQIQTNIISLLSHKTSNPIVAILGLSECLIESNELDKESMQMISEIKKAGCTLHQFIRQTAQLVKLKTGVVLNKTRNLVIDEIKDKACEINYTCKEKNITFKIELNQTYTLNADWSLLSSVLTCLLGNAAKYSDENAEVLIFSTLEEDKYQIHIKDNGPGIKRDRIEDIFNELAISHIEHAYDDQSLNMPISKHIMELHGGSISVISTPGEGSTFSLSFPLD